VVERPVYSKRVGVRDDAGQARARPTAEASRGRARVPVEEHAAPVLPGADRVGSVEAHQRPLGGTSLRARHRGRRRRAGRGDHNQQ
jgi:hypothetical protein